MLKTKFYNFIWKSKTDRIKRNVLNGGYDNGGLKMLDLTNFIPALKCVWLRRILKSCTDWAHLFETNYGSEFTKNLADFGDYFLQSNYKENPKPFWSDVFESWQRVIRNSKVANIFFTKSYMVQ